MFCFLRRCDEPATFYRGKARAGVSAALRARAPALLCLLGVLAILGCETGASPPISLAAPDAEASTYASDATAQSRSDTASTPDAQDAESNDEMAERSSTSDAALIVPAAATVPVRVEALFEASVEGASGEVELAWTLEDRPDGSIVPVDRVDFGTSSLLHFRPDIEGAYTLKVRASGSDWETSERIYVQAINHAPTVATAESIEAHVGDVVILDAVPDDPNGDHVKLEWRLISAPLGSNASVYKSWGAQRIVPDLVGTYTIGVRGHDGSLWGPESVIEVSAVMTLPFFPDAFPVSVSGGYARDVAVGDLNGDDVPDLVAVSKADPGWNSVHILEQLEPGLFWETKILDTGLEYTTTLAVCDVDGDGLDDVVVPHAEGLGLYWQLAAGAIVDTALVMPLDLGQWAYRLGCGQFDPDPGSEIVMVTTSQVFVLDFGDSGALEVIAEFETTLKGSDRLAIGDIDDNGHDDIVVMAGWSHPENSPVTLSLYYNHGPEAGLQGPFTVSLASGGQGVAIADVDDDGLTEVLVGYEDFSKGWTTHLALLDLHDPMEPQQTLIDTISDEFVLHVAAADLSGDGRMEVVVTVKGKVRVYRQLEEGTFEEPEQFLAAADEFSKGMQLTDLNADGIPDLITCYNVVQIRWGNPSYSD